MVCVSWSFINAAFVLTYEQRDRFGPQGVFMGFVGLTDAYSNVKNRAGDFKNRTGVMIHKLGWVVVQVFWG